jgi:hypothetical protein
MKLASRVGLDRRSATLQAAAVVAIAGGFALIALAAVRQVRHLIWRPAEIGRMLHEAVSLAADFPVRFGLLVALSVALMIAAEYRPRALLHGSAAAWIGVGWIGVGAYVLGVFDLGYRWVLAVLLLVGTAATTAAVVRVARRETGSEDRSQGRGSPWSARRAVLPMAVGLVGGVLAARASIEPVTQWDAIVTHVSFARDWLQALPGLPHAAGPSGGAEVSYNYPALFSSIAVAIAAPLHLAAADVARVVSPLAAVTLLAALRVVGTRSGFAGWAPSMFVLGSTLFVAYAQWPTAYMLLLLMLVLAAGLLYADRSLSAASAALIGLAAGTALIGLFFAAIVMCACAAFAGRRRFEPRPVGTAHSVLSRVRDNAVPVALLTGPIALVALASLYYTRSLFFPWLSWPGGGQLLPRPEWSSTRDILAANPYGHPDADFGNFARAVRGIATSDALAPGGLVLAGLVAVACVVAAPSRHRGLRSGLALVVAASLLLVSLSLVRFGYFLPVIVASAVGIGTGLSALQSKTSLGWRRFRIATVARAAAVAGAVACLAAGAAYAIAGPNDRVPTMATSYRTEHASAFETARSAADAKSRVELVFGDDARAWSDIDTLDARGLAVGTFDVRSYYATYRPSLQLDGLAGAAIRGASASAVVAGLKGRGIDAVFVPSAFWEAGPTRNSFVDRSPVALWVGAPSLQAIRVYLPSEDVGNPSVLYAVGARSARRIESILHTPALSIAGPLSSWKAGRGDGFVFGGILGGGAHWRVTAPVTEDRGPVLRFTSGALGSLPDVTIDEPRTPTLFEEVGFVDCSRAPGWARVSTLDVVLPGSPLGFAALDIGGRPDRKDRFSGGVALRRARVLVRACGDPTGARGGVFPAGSPSSRIIVSPPSSGRLLLSFGYLDEGNEPVSFRVYDDLHDSWRGRAVTVQRCGSGRWLHATLPLPRPSLAGTEIRLAPVVAREDLAVRGLRLDSHGPVRVPRCRVERPDARNLLARRSLAALSSGPGTRPLADAR